MGRTEEENKDAEDQPWAWLIGYKVVLVDWDDEEKKIRNIALAKDDVIHPYTNKPILHWLSYAVKSELVGGHFFVH